MIWRFPLKCCHSSKFYPANTHGSFAGLGPDVRTGNGFGYGQINVTATVAGISATNQSCNGSGEEGVNGCTVPTNWGQTYVPTSTPDQYITQSITTYIQMVELGNALTVITGQMTWAEAATQDRQSNYSNPPGTALANCLGITPIYG